MRIALLACVVSAWLPLPLPAQNDPLVRPYTAEQCSACAGWNAPQSPVHLHGNTYYVGTRGLGAILIASAAGHVLIDGGLPNSAPLILANIRALGFDVRDVKLILNSHAHFDHAGGIAALKRATGARVAASRSSIVALRRGTPSADDPQYGIALEMPAVPDADVLVDSQTIRVGPLALTAHVTGGHSPGGTTWSWRSCEAERCLDFVYADSQSPVSRDDFRFANSNAQSEFLRGFARLEQIRCDILITPHPSASSLWERISAAQDSLVDPTACKRYAGAARAQLQARLERETK